MIKGLRAILKSRGMTQAALAEATGLSTATISLMMAGKRGFSRESLGAIARTLDVDPAELMIDQGADQDDGLHEPPVPSFEPAHSDEPALAALLAAAAPAAQHPAAYTARRAIPMAAIMAGDLLVIDLNTTARGGDLVLAQLVDPDTSETRAELYRWSPPHLVSLDAMSTDPVLAIENGAVGRLWCNIVGPVLAVLRTQVSSARDTRANQS